MVHFSRTRAAAHLRRVGATALLLVALAVPSVGALAAADEDDQAASEEPDAGTTRWSITPAVNEDDQDDESVENRISLRMEIEPGESVTDAVTVTNYGDRAETFEVYASDGVITADGQFDVLPSSTEATGAGSWVSVGDGGPGESIMVELDPESDVTLPVEIFVPEGATPGDQPAGVVASLANDTGGVGMESRVGTRIHLRVAGDLEPTLAIRDVDTRYESSWNPLSPGTLRLTYRLENTGNIRLGSESAATGAGLFGVGERSGPGTEHREILPGESASAVVTLENVWPLLRMGGDVDVIPVVVGDDVVEVPLEGVEVAWSAWTLPWVYLIALALLIAVVVGRRRLKVRREANTQAQIEAAVKSAQGADDKDSEDDPVAAS